MDTASVIEARGLGKAYRIWSDPAARLKYPLLKLVWGLLPRSLRPAYLREDSEGGRFYRDFHALRDFSLTVRKGEAIGIIGRNGSGKSTLLQMIAGTLTPSSGEVLTQGRVAALLELGSGFNPDFTGRENVYLNGAVLGLSRREIDERYDSIAAFAEIGDFINQPVRTYSSGMVIRLAFAVASHVDPDILIIDEALSVGDARFQLKCARAIDRFVAKGVTLLFVSHDTTAIKRLCNHAILLEQGRMVYAGIPNDVVNLYSKLIAEGGSLASIQEDLAALAAASPGTRTASPLSPLSTPGTEPPLRTPPPPDCAATLDELQRLRLHVKALELCLHEDALDRTLGAKAEALLKEERLHVQVSGQEFHYGGELGRIHRIEVLDAEGVARTWFNSGEAVKVLLDIESFESLPEPIFALTIKNVSGVEVYGTNSLYNGQPAAPLKPGEKRGVSFSFPLNLMPGHYFLSLGLTHFFGEELLVVHRRYDAVRIEVHALDKSFGIANLHARIEYQEGRQP